MKRKIVSWVICCLVLSLVTIFVTKSLDPPLPRSVEGFFVWGGFFTGPFLFRVLRGGWPHEFRLKKFW